MSGWLLAVREVYRAGGATTVAKLTCPLEDINNARRQGMLERPGRHGRLTAAPVVITPLGRALCENRLEFYVPTYQRQANGGRAKNSHRRLRTTWLAALPEGVRLTPSEHRAQNDGTCYW